MTIRAKFLLALLPTLLALIIGLGWWHYAVAAAGVERATQLYLDTVLDDYLESELNRRHRLLLDMGVAETPSFVHQYQREALAAARRLAARHQGDFLVIDGDGALLHATGGLATEGLDRALLQRHAEGGVSMEGAHIQVRSGGEPHGLIYSARTFAGWDWRVLFLVSDDDYHRSLDGIRYSTLSVAGLLVVALPLLLYSLSQRFLLHPIERLGEAAERIAHHQPPAPIEVSGDDELGGLARNMERMARDILTSQERLEQRVRERTAELEASGRRLAAEIDERRAAQAALEQAGERLRDSNRELQQFAYVVSHDLQEPLRMVSSYLQLIARRYHGALDERADDFIDFAVDGATRMAAMIDGLLEFSRVESHGAPFVATDLSRLLDDALANLELAISECGAEVSRGELPVLAVDPAQMTRLLQNLVGNAVKFRGEEPPRIRIDAERTEAWWWISVSDNGIGIDPKQAAEIFSMFQRLHTREEYPGMGIGLAVCKRIVEHHGGIIEVNPAKGGVEGGVAGGGSCFRFSLPFTADPVAEERS